jgi:copper chaperone CopZ
MKREALLRISRAAIGTGLLSIAAIGASAKAEGLLEVEQIVFGMDCTPCAYGVEKSLSRLPGVEKVTVSLNQGKASLILAPANRVTIQQIRTRIRDGGFTPKEAYVRAAGKIMLRDDQVELAIAPGSVLRLTPSTQADLRWHEIRTAEPGATAEIAGRIAQDPGDPPLVSVDKVILISKRDPSGQAARTVTSSESVHSGQAQQLSAAVPDFMAP